MAELGPTTFEMVGDARLRELRGHIPLLLLCATDVERKGIIQQLRGLNDAGRPLKGAIGPQTYYIGLLGKYPVVVTMCAMGTGTRDGSLNTVRDAAAAWTPKAIIMVGIAFGKDPKKQALGDVLVSTQIISYEPERVAEAPQNRGPVVDSGRTLLNRFKNVDGWAFVFEDGRVSECHFGPVLSGEKLVDDATFKQKLFERYPAAVGGEMEGAGLYAASVAVGLTEWIIVKGICDWADGHKDKRYQAMAVAAAVDLVKHVLSDPYAFESWLEAPVGKELSDSRTSREHARTLLLLGEYFFEVEQVEFPGDGRVVVNIECEPGAIDAAMRELNPNGSIRGVRLSLAYANDASLVTVGNVSHTIRAGVQHWRLELKTQSVQNSTDYSLNTGNIQYSPDDQAALRARWILLNAKPSGPSGSGSDALLESFLKGGPIPATGSPLPELYHQFAGDEVRFRDCGRLRCVAALRLSSTVETITKLELGPIRDGKVNVDFEGRRRRQYENRPATVLRVKGECILSNP